MKYKASCQLQAGHQRSIAGKEKGHAYRRLFSLQILSLLLHIGLFKYNRESNLNIFAVKRVN